MTTEATPPAPKIAKGSLKRRTMRGAAWTTAQFGLSSIFRLGSNLVLTRLLMPEAFGLIGVVLMIQFLMTMISDIGIKSSIIRSDHSDDPDFISTAWVLQMGRGVLMVAVMVLIAGLVAMAAHFGWVKQGSIYADPRVPLFIMFGALATLLDSTRSIKFYLAERNFKLGWVSVTQLSGQILSSIVTIALAWWTHHPISLAIGILINPALVTIASHLYFQGPSFSIKVKRKYIDEMFKYGVWILIASLFSFFAQRGAQLLFGFYLDAKEFSFLSIALILITIVRQGLRTVQRRVGLPAFAELRRKRPQDQTRAYYRMRLASDGFAIFVFLGTLFLSGPILDFAYPDSYDRMITYVQLLSVSILFVPFELMDTVLLSEGSSRQFSNIKFVTALGILIGIPVSYPLLGADGAILISSLAPGLAVPLTLFYGRKTIKIDLKREMILPVLALFGFLYLLLR